MPILESEAGVYPFPTGETESLKHWSSSREAESNKYTGESSPEGSLHVVVVVKNTGIHLSVSGWRHELELRGIHKDRAVLRIIHII